ncbi:hypothetical protein FRX31_022016 [Thalictrum thalictroides]|uniref:Uncharacterized protein n=1 Tax=Thalictrum thalictroides TaxID=46969 RepID=A0A7J6VUL1_THATH|nr:hypothetical protein FRX31_022016 [Thalictrum thalictroides]
MEDMQSAVNKAKGSSTLIHHMWIGAVVGGSVSIWFHRNRVFFEGDDLDLNFCKKYRHSQVLVARHSSNGFSRDHDDPILRAWGVEGKRRKAPRMKECFW